MLSKRRKDRSRAFAPVASRREMRRRARSAIMAERNDDGLAAWVRSHPTSHFSAVLDQHYPQAVKINLYGSSTANSRRKFRSETRKSSSESDDEDALRFARGSSER